MSDVPTSVLDKLPAYIENPERTGCPVCGGWEIEGDCLTVTNGGCEQDIRCLNCGSSWVEVYKLVDVRNIAVDHDWLAEQAEEECESE